MVFRMLSGLSYISSVNQYPTNPMVGHICYHTDTQETYLYDGNEWVQLGSVKDEPRRLSKVKRFKCECCGAPLPIENRYYGIVKCEYCGMSWDVE